MAVVKTTIKGQVVIPAPWRKKFNITPGTKVMILEKEEPYESTI